MVGAANALHKPFDVFGRTDLDHKVHIAPVDPQIQTAGTDDGPQVSAHHSGLDLEPLFAVQRAVVNADRQGLVIGEPEIVKKDLCLRPGVVENQSGFVLFDLFQNRRNGIGRAPA